MYEYNQNCCRVCFKKCYKNQSALTDIMSNNITILEAYNQCTQLQALLDDEMPQILCLNCSKDLHKFYIFLYKAKETAAKFRNISENLHLKQEWDLEGFELELNAIKTTPNTVLKDPLEESEDEPNDILHNIGESTPKQKYTEDASTQSSEDDEDNKPLKDLMKKIQSISKVSQNQAGKGGANDETKTVMQNNADSETEDFELNSNYTGNTMELTLSAESQIFPQGQFKCKTCGKCYFTDIGLKAHLDIHLPKNNATSSKRKRSKSKKDYDMSSVNNIPKNNENINKDEIMNVPKEVQSLDEQVAVVYQNIESKDKPQKPKKIFPCQICGKLMISASKLRYHMVMHTGEKDYLCTICPKAYSTIYALKHHIRTHTGERPYECKFCGERFLRPTTLKSHLRRHTGERPYGCNICGKRFIQHSSMTTHFRLNHMDKTIPCPHCHKKYARQTDLNTHLLSHTGDKPFSCQLCPSRFIRQANLNKHMNQQHLGKTNESKHSKKATNKNTELQKSYKKDANNIINAETGSKDHKTNTASLITSINLNSQNTATLSSQTNQTSIALIPTINFPEISDLTQSQTVNNMQQETFETLESVVAGLEHWNSSGIS